MPRQTVGYSQHVATPETAPHSLWQDASDTIQKVRHSSLGELLGGSITKSLGLNPTLDEFAQPGLDDSVGKARLKGFLTGAAEAVTPMHVAAAASLGSGLPAAVGNSMLAAQGIGEATDPEASTVQKVSGVANAIGGGAGALSGFLKSGVASKVGAFAKDFLKSDPAAAATKGPESFTIEPTGHSGPGTRQGFGKSQGRVPSPKVIKGSGDTLAATPLPADRVRVSQGVPYGYEYAGGPAAKSATKEALATERLSNRFETALNAKDVKTQNELDGLDKSFQAADKDRDIADVIANERVGLEPKSSISESMSRKTDLGNERRSVSYQQPAPKKTGVWAEDPKADEPLGALDSLRKAMGVKPAVKKASAPTASGVTPPPAGPAKDIFDAWVAKGRDPKEALKLAGKGVAPTSLKTGAPPVEPTAPDAVTATYAHDQPGVGPMYQVNGGPSHDSTVSASKLQELGIPVPEAPAPAVVEQQPVDPESQLMRFFKSRVDAAGQGHRDIRAAQSTEPSLTQPTILSDSTGRPYTPSNIAGKNLQQEAKAAGLPVGKAARVNTPVEPVPQEPQTPQQPQGPDVPGVPAETLLDNGEVREGKFSELMKLLKSQPTSGEGGAIDPKLLSLLARTGVGAVLGGAAGGQYGHPVLGALGGAAAGGIVPAAVSRDAAEGMIHGQEGFTKGLGVANRFHNATLLSPLSVIKKAAGDVGGLTTAGMENGDKAVGILKALTGGLGEAWHAGREAWNEPVQEGLTGLENIANRGPLSWSGRMMSGLTAGTKNVLDQAGFSPEEQAYYTLTSKPETTAGQKLLDAQRGSPLIQHVAPFARLGINRIERGLERSPAGLYDALMAESPEAAQKALKRAFSGTTIAGAAYALTPEDFAKNHPVATGMISALGGPMSLPIAGGMALKTSAKSPSAEVAKTVSRDVPGLRLIEDMTASPYAALRNYLSGYTNVTRPLAELKSPNEPDVTGPQSHIYDKTMANVPFLRETLPLKSTPRPSRRRVRYQ